MKNFKTELEHLRREKKQQSHPYALETGYFDAVLEMKPPKSAAQMEALIVEFLRLNGHQAQKVTTTGVYRDDKKTFTDQIGRSRVIGTGTWTAGTSTKGAADIRATIYGLDYQFEVKFSKSDRQSDKQKQFENSLKLSHGEYYLIQTLDKFLEVYNWIMDSDKVKLMKEFYKVY